MTDADVAQIILGVLGLAAAGLAAFFAWRDWERGRWRWNMRFEHRLHPEHYGEHQRDKALFVDVIVTCQRNSIRVQRIVLRRDKRSGPLRAAHTFPALSPPATLTAGGEVRDSFLSDKVAPYHRGPEGPLREACWFDAEGKAHCRPIPEDTIAALLADGKA